MNNQRRRAIQIVMRSLEIDTHKIRYIQNEYDKQLKLLKESSQDAKDNVQIESIEQKSRKLFSIRFDMEDVYEILEEVVGKPIKKTPYKTVVEVHMASLSNLDLCNVFRTIIENLNSHMDDLETVSMEEQDALDNVQEYFPDSMRAMDMEEYVDDLDTAIGEIGEVIAALEEMMS